MEFFWTYRRAQEFVVQNCGPVLSFVIFFLLFFSLEWPEIRVHLSLILFHEPFNWKLGQDSSDSLAMVWPVWPFLYKGRLGQGELVANLPTAFFQLRNSKDIYVTGNLYTCGQGFHAAQGSFHAEQQERLLSHFPRAEHELIFSWAVPHSPWPARGGLDTCCMVLLSGLSL